MATRSRSRPAKPKEQTQQRFLSPGMRGRAAEALMRRVSGLQRRQQL